MTHRRMFQYAAIAFARLWSQFQRAVPPMRWALQLSWRICNRALSRLKYGIGVFYGVGIYTGFVLYYLEMSSFVVYQSFWVLLLVAGCIPPNTLTSPSRIYVRITEWFAFVYGTFFLVVLSSGKTLDVLCLHGLGSIAFHVSEGKLVCALSPTDAEWDRFLLNNGWQQTACQALSILELWLRATVFQQSVETRALSMLFLAGCIESIMGLALRIWAIVTAGESFTHVIVTPSSPDNVKRPKSICKKGPYAMCRHPGYLGWFFWSSGM